jgi:methyl-accepting chemotaxis protein
VQDVARSAAGAAEAAQRARTSASEGHRVMDETGVAIKRVASESERTSKAINELKAQSEKAAVVLDVIQSVAEQTNLLALNAAIEAARAGEQGRGFAVVADEVRTLASRTQKSAEEIRGIIGQLQRDAANAVEVMSQGTEAANQSVERAVAAQASLAEINKAVGEISDRNLQIATAAEEQTTVTEEINRNVSAIRQGSEHSADDAERLAASSQALDQLARELAQTVGRFRI